MITQLQARVAFCGDLDELDPDLAAAKLRQAGYEVSLLPDKYRWRLAHPLDDFIEAVITVPDDPRSAPQAGKRSKPFVAKYRGVCNECGPIDPEN